MWFCFLVANFIKNKKTALKFAQEQSAKHSDKILSDQTGIRSDS